MPEIVTYWHGGYDCQLWVRQP